MPTTPHLELTDALREDLALFSFGLLEAEQAAEIERHLQTGCRLCLEELRAFGDVAVELTPAVAPPPSLKGRLLERTQREEPESGVRYTAADRASGALRRGKV